MFIPIWIILVLLLIIPGALETVLGISFLILGAGFTLALLGCIVWLGFCIVK